MTLKAIRFVFFAVILALGLTISVPLRAQVAGAILSGTISDSSGAVITNAKVSVRNVATDVSTDTTTNTEGAYNLLNLIPADYEVSVSAPGFSTTVAKVTLTVGAKQRMNLSLTVGQVSQEVQVSGTAPEIELATSTVSGNIEGTEVRELPLNGRDWSSLATLQPGVVSVRMHAPGTQFGSRGFGLQLTISGTRPMQNVYRLDGGIVNDFANGGPGSVLGQNLGVDAIQEFSVLTSNYTAEYGFTSGGVVNAVTRSGTNTFHGTAFDFIRNDKFDAAGFFDNAFGNPKADLKQNQFGASGGWRILKDRVFLFGDYEGVRQVKGSSTSNFTLSNAVHAGNVTNLSTGVVTAVPIYNSTIQKYLALFPAPNGAANCTGCNANVGLFNWEAINRTTENFLTFRADQKISNKDSLFETYFRDPSYVSAPLALDLVAPVSTAYRQAIIVEETHVFSPSLVNTVRLAYDRTYGFSNHSDSAAQAVNPAAADQSLAMIQAPGYFAPGISFSGTNITAPPTSGSGTQQDIWNQIIQVYDDAFVTHGNHGFKFGFTFDAQQNNVRSVNGRNGSGTFSAALATAAATADCTNKSGKGIEAYCGALVNFLTDQPRTASRGIDLVIDNKHYLRDKVAGGYFQDDWRFRPSLTLNLGLRYEMQTNISETHNEVAYLRTLYSPTTDLAPGFYARNPTLKNFEPRIGFAWDPFHNGKTAVRGGFGIFDALPAPFILQLFAATTAPFQGNFAAVGPPVSASPAQGVWPFGIPALALLGNAATTQTWGYVDANIKRNYDYQYSLNIQRQITPTITLVVGYAGSRGIHNPFLDDSANLIPPVNLGHPIPGVGYYWPIPYIAGTPAGVLARLNPNVGSIRSVLWQSMSYYNGLQVKLDKRLSHGFQVQGAFTWAKSIDNVSGSTVSDSFSNDYASPPWWDLSINRGLSAFHVGRNLVINGLWDTPTPHALGAFGERVVGGWQLGVITSVADGVPFYPSVGAEAPDILGQDIYNTNPPWFLGGPGCSTLTNPGNVANYIKTQCLGLPPQTTANTPFCDTARAIALNVPGTCPNIRGNLGRNSIIGPGLVNFDFSTIKNNYIKKISETFNVQFRAEFFNLFNRANFQMPPTADAANAEIIGSNGQPQPAFGRIVSTQTPNREIQFALKLIW